METDQLISTILAAAHDKAAAEDNLSPLQPPDAIDIINARPLRVTAVQDLRNSAEMEDFRRKLVDAEIENDAVRQALIAVNTILTRAFAMGIGG